MGVRFIVNFVLLALPIGITLGILMGLDLQRKNNGEDSLYTPDDGKNGGSGSSPPKKGNGFTKERICNQTYGYIPYTTGQQYTLNPNQWGWEEGDDGGLCLNVTTRDNGTYVTKTTAPDWSVTWQYPRGPETQPVHAFANIMVDNVFPEKLSSVKEINIGFNWTYGVGTTASSDTDVTALEAAALNANVAMDMFMDSDKSQATDAEKASHEVMVWFAAVGSATQPIGMTVDGVVQTAITNVTIDSTNFGLFAGNNSKNQTVLTWMSADTADTFSGDLFSLVEKLYTLDESNGLSKDYYLGYLAWGTEAYSSDQNVTFNVPDLSIDIEI